MAFTNGTSLNHPVRILLVDDNSNGLAARRSVLEELGYHIVTSATVAEALGAFERNSFDLIITDYKLPDFNGVHFIGKIRETRPELPVILISGFIDTLGLDEKSTGANAVIQKSSNEVNQLVRAVSRLLRRKPPARAAAKTSSTRRRAG